MSLFFAPIPVSLVITLGQIGSCELKADLVVMIEFGRD
jgi:hypothetical protein